MAGRDGGRRGGWNAPSRGAPADRRRGRGRNLAGRDQGVEQQQEDGRAHAAARGRGQERGGRAARGAAPGRGGAPPPGGHGAPRGRGRFPRPAAGDTGNVGSGAAAGASGAGPVNDTEAAMEPHGDCPVHGEEAIAEGANDDQAKKRKRKDPSLKLDCAICTEEHLTSRCPLLRGPKPTVALCGAAEDGMGFFQIQAAKKIHIVDSFQSAAAACITVETGEIPPQLLRTELARIIPVAWDWEVQQIGAKSFVVPFPNKEELDRMIAIGTFTTKNKEGSISFAAYEEDDIQPFRLLEQTWVTVTRVPRVLRSFLQLWAVGTIIGTTQKVDMVHLRATGQVRIRVAVYDVKKIPEYADVCVGIGVYRLYFKADETVPVDPVIPNDDDDLLGESDKEQEGSDREMEDADASDKNQQNNAPPSDKTPAQQQIPPHKQAAIVSEAVDIACAQLIEEISVQVMLETEEDHTKEGTLLANEHTNLGVSPAPSIVDAPTDAALLGGSTSPTTPLPALESYHGDVVAAAGLGGSSPTSQAGFVTTTLELGPVPGASVGGVSTASLEPATVSSPPSPQAGSVSTTLELGAVQGAGEGGVATTFLESATVEDHHSFVVDETMGRVVDASTAAASGGSSPPLTPQADPTTPMPGVEDGGPGDEEETTTPPGSGGSSPPPRTPQAVLTPSLLLTAPLAGEGEGGVEERLTPTTTPAAGERPPAVTAAPIKVLRRSVRNAGVADVHTLDKIERMAVKKNLEFAGTSFNTFPDSKVISNLGRIGINLGTSDVVSIKNLEVDRLVLNAKTKKSSINSRLSHFESDDERESQIDAVLSHVSGHLNEDLLKGERDQILDLSPLPRKKKYNNAKNMRKGKLPKKPKTPSKIFVK